jgi:hypothetical protein
MEIRCQPLARLEIGSRQATAPTALATSPPKRLSTRQGHEKRQWLVYTIFVGIPAFEWL